MPSWLGYLIFYGLPALLILSGIKGILTGQLGFGRDTAEGWKARVLGVVYIIGAIFFLFVLRILSKT